MPDIRYLIMAKKSVLVPALMKFRDYLGESQDTDQQGGSYNYNLRSI